MGSLPLFISPCYLYEQKEHFTLAGIMNTLTEHSYLTPLPALQHGSISLFISARHLYEEKELFTLPGIIITFTGVPSIVQLFMTPP